MASGLGETMTGPVYVPAAASGTRIIGISIPVPEPYGSELQNWRASFGDPLAGAIPTHVTLLPPTEIVEDILDEVESHLRKVAESESAFRMRLRGTGTFRPISPVVFVQVSEGVRDCERIERKVRSGILDREIRFPYHPHITVAHDLSDEALDAAYQRLSRYEADFEVTGFSLYEYGSDGVWRVRLPLPFADDTASRHR